MATVPLRSKFETEMPVRPDDIDMNQHVHNSRYFDYVLAARYDQMARCYRMPMEGVHRQRVRLGRADGACQLQATAGIGGRDDRADLD